MRVPGFSPGDDFWRRFHHHLWFDSTVITRSHILHVVSDSGYTLHVGTGRLQTGSHLLVFVHLRSTSSRMFPRNDFQRRFHYSLFGRLISRYAVIRQYMEEVETCLHRFVPLIVGGSFSTIFRGLRHEEQVPGDFRHTVISPIASVFAALLAATVVTCTASVLQQLYA